MIIKNIEGCGAIYCITNKINQKKYIGQTSSLYINDRWCEHKWNARNNKSGYLYNAIRKYGEENFEFKVLLHKIPINALNYYESLWIQKFNTKSPYGYNLTDGGDGTRGYIPWNKDIPRSQETINKIKLTYTEEKRQKMAERVLGINNPMYGKYGSINPSYGYRRYNGDNPFYGKHHTEETKKILSNAQKNKKQKVAMIDINTGNRLMTFNSYSEAAKYLRDYTQYIKADDSAISRCARGIYECVYGYKWERIYI